MSLSTETRDQYLQVLSAKLVKVQSMQQIRKYRQLCAPCAKLFRKGCFCDHCEQVYNESDMLDGKLWIGCDDVKCGKWNHAFCEVEFGVDEDMKALAMAEVKAEEDRKNRGPDVVSDAAEPEGKYYCLKCRKKNKTAKITKSPINKPLAPKKAAL
jgi:hypothetical protein